MKFLVFMHSWVPNKQTNKLKKIKVVFSCEIVSFWIVICTVPCSVLSCLWSGTAPCGWKVLIWTCAHTLTHTHTHTNTRVHAHMHRYAHGNAILKNLKSAFIWASLALLSQDSTQFHDLSCWSDMPGRITTLCYTMWPCQGLGRWKWSSTPLRQTMKPLLTAWPMETVSQLLYWAILESSLQWAYLLQIILRQHRKFNIFMWS